MSWAWEIKSVNGRSLDVRLRVPPGFDAVGEDARKLFAGLVARGSIQVGLTVQRVETRRAAVRINTDVLTALADAITALPASLHFKPASLDGLLQVRGVVEADDQDEQGLSSELHSELVAALSRAARALVDARQQEGAALHGVLLQQLVAMRVLVASFENHPARSVSAIKGRLQTQLAALLDGREQLDEARLYQEAAMLATRADVREELDRLSAHINQTTDLLTQGGPVGRKLDFLAQEFGREASTLCAKANHVELSRIGLELRALVDQFREQVQNVE